MRDRSIPVLLATCIALAAGTAHAETFLIQSGQDSSPYAFTPNSARGTLSASYVFTAFASDGADHSFESYIRFNLPLELLEPGVQVDYAYAWVYHGFSFVFPGEEDLSDEIGELQCHEVLAPWTEAGTGALTWNHRPPIGPVFDQIDGILNEGLYWCDVTEVLEGWLQNPSSNYGIALTSRLKRVMGFHSFQDGSVSPNFRPSLLVETVPEPAATTSLIAGALLLVTLERRRMRVRRSHPHPHPSQRRAS